MNVSNAFAALKYADAPNNVPRNLQIAESAFAGCFAVEVVVVTLGELGFSGGESDFLFF